MATIVGVPFELPFWPGGTSPAVTNFALNQTTDQLEWIIQAVDAITITRVGFRQGALTGIAPVYKVSIQGVDGNGNPDGTIKGGGSPASATFTPIVGDNGLWLWKTLANSYTCTRGEFISIVITYSSGTIDASNTCSFTSTGNQGKVPGIPYAIQNDNGARTRNAGSAIIAYGSVGTVYGQPLKTALNSVFGVASTPDEFAVLFNIPTSWWSTYKVLGAVLYRQLTAAGTYNLTLYDTDGTTVLHTKSFDADQDRAVGATGTQVFFSDAVLATLNAGSSYRLSFAPTVQNIVRIGLSVDTSADMDAYLGGSTVAQASTRTDAGAWTDDPLTRFGINPILADIAIPPVPIGRNMVIQNIGTY